MHNTILKQYAKFQNLKSSEQGQGLAEYALLAGGANLIWRTHRQRSRRRVNTGVH
jgi:hypothetical protein